MKILILGGTRFIGKKLTENLLKHGHQIDIISRKTQDESSSNPCYYIADRKDVDSLGLILQNKEYDCIIDMINFSSKDSSIIHSLFKTKKLKTAHYITISTAYTYLPDGGSKIQESQFDPFSYPMRVIDRPEVNYEEGKRLSEAYIAQCMSDFKYSIIRFPIIIGNDDYTFRFFYFLNKILKNEKALIFDNQKKMSYIDSDDAANFIQWITEKKVSGIYNAACEGEMTEKEFATTQYQLCNKLDLISLSLHPLEQTGPMFTKVNLTLDCTKARKSGFLFSDLSEKIKEHSSIFVKNLMN